MKNGKEKEIKDNVIFKNDSKIKSNVKMIHECLNTLNHNYSKIKEYNAYLSHKVAYFLTFYCNSMDRQRKKFIGDAVKGEIATLLDNNNPFSSLEMVEGFYSEIIQNFFLTKEGGQWHYNSNSPIKSLRFDLMKFCERFVAFDADKDEFTINENEGLTMMDELTHTAQNARQQKALDLLRAIDNNLNELNDLGLGGLITLNSPRCRFSNNVPFADIWKNIQNIK